ncbi:papilin-like [Mya arenaria]|uniref:papilin-like n=1 Tax=Mya arenaria TaxID=6604 RepID=UPI0022E3E3D7|nr:papilin-like [Mya arenaria]
MKACTLPPKSGPCKAYFPRYFYNTTSCSCEKFIYGGCQPNENNFDTLDACEKACNNWASNVCSLPKVVGLCKAYFPRWYFDKDTCTCRTFVYGGCQGNDNRFDTKEDCESHCRCYECPGLCDLPILAGDPPVICLAYFPKYGFNSATCQCEKFIYGGCGGNGNRFDTIEECESKCPGCPPPIPSCKDSPDTGKCDAVIPRFFYNTTACQCQTFNWGGCGGNGNNYETMDDCLKQCKDYGDCDQDKTNNCYLPADTGPCEALIKRFHYDPLECKCKSFTYGGCEGNSNNFLSNRKCKRACGNSTCPVCNLPSAAGPCKGSFQRFFFNIQTCMCEPFIYGGCGGNENKYDTKEECQALCGSIMCPVCNLPPKRGGCKANLQRWHFDAASCSCKPFTYGGCGGNMNRFLSEADCKGACGSYPCPVCALNLKVGPCRTAINRWYYDANEYKCKEFSWGGCQPNGNNFLSKKTCNKICKAFVCTLPKKVGSCAAGFKRYYYDKASKMCKKFLWSGCESNGNNFATKRKCRRRCVNK